MNGKKSSRNDGISQHTGKNQQRTAKQAIAEETERIKKQKSQLDKKINFS
jgi:uncharacterized FlaG/YvyC family protein